MAEENRPLSTAALAGREDQPPPGQGSERVETSPPTSEERQRLAGQAPESARAGAGETRAPLLAPQDSQDFQTRWDDAQRGFVDEPRDAVQQADELVAELMQTLAKGFADKRASLEGQWSRGEEVSTEDLRMALQRYRSFFQRLLAV